MTPEIITICLVGVALGALVLNGHRSIHKDMGDLRRDVGELRERLAKIEGTVETLSQNVTLLTRSFIDREQAKGI